MERGHSCPPWVCALSFRRLLGTEFRMNTTTLDKLGIIAGNRSLPLTLAREAKKAGIAHVVAVAFEGETDPALESLVDEIVWTKVGQLSRLIEALKSRGIRQCVMVGQIAPRNLFDVRPDFRAMTLLFRIKEKNAHTLFGAVADELHKEGIELIEATPWLKPLMPEAGFCLGPRLTEEQRGDVDFGYKLAKEISRLEIGQTVVVKNGATLAVEAFEGTDRCLARGGELASKEGGAVAVKVAKHNHDMRFDIPCLGSKTVEVCAANGIAVIAFEAGKTLVLDLDQVEIAARKHRVAVVAVGE
jgi:UDP-2,3-diacylglucosamine hydrolase